jgi:glyoxylase-like metal-dependent hydrolase (beta-lactamase superfamily II)
VAQPQQPAAAARAGVARRVATRSLERVAPGVWRLRGGFPIRTMNVYLLEEPEGGVSLFDASIRQMAKGIAAAAEFLGGLRRVVLGHAHPDHRGAAPALGVPVLCHSAERADAEGDGGWRYYRTSLLRPPTRWVLPELLRRWDGGPVRIAGTLEEGDEVAGFRVVHLPGHAPGQIALVRDRDRVALTTDVFYVIDIGSGRSRPPQVPEPAFNQDTEQARASIRKLAALEPAAAWPGHAGPLTGDVRSALERAAETT